LDRVRNGLFTTSISGTLRSEWLPRGSNSRPLHVERVDFLRTDVAGEDRRAIWSDTDLGTELHPIHHPAQISQTGDGFNLVVGESQALRFGYRASGCEVEILMIRRETPVHEVVACDKVAPFLSLEIIGQDAAFASGC